MRITIYNSTDGSRCLNGVDAEAATIAEAVADVHSVELVHHKPWLTLDQLMTAFDVRLEGVRLRCVEPEPNPFGTSANPLRRYRQARSRLAGVSERADLLIVLACDTPPFCHAPAGILRVIFPMFGGHDRWPFRGPSRGWAGGVKQAARTWYHKVEWKRRLAGYQAVVSISEFTREWTRKWWEVDSEVIYPAVDVPDPTDPAAAKADQIVSVGRFHPFKCYAEMLATFAELPGARRAGWNYVCAGGKDDAEYYASLLPAATAAGVQLLPGVSRERLRDLYTRSSIFWHACRFNDDDRTNPEQAEHFGITPVEAMAGGCVPVVANRAGLRETVRHGVDGFHFNTLDELAGYTAELIADVPLRRRMSAAARERAWSFRREAFMEQFRSLVRRFEPGGRSPLAGRELGHAAAV